MSVEKSASSTDDASEWRSRLATISSSADFDVTNITQPRQKTTAPREERAMTLNRRQQRLREKLDERLEVEFQRLFGKEKTIRRNAKKSRESAEKVTEEREAGGIRLFKHMAPGIPFTTKSRTNVVSVTKRPKKRKLIAERRRKMKSRGKDGVWRFKGLAVIDSDDILKTAEKIRCEGVKRLQGGQQTTVETSHISD